MSAAQTKTRNELTVTTPSDLEIVMTRAFDAPRELVFQAHIDPEAIPHWWGLRRYQTIVDKMDVRPGGAWRYIQRGPEGEEHAFSGEFREIKPPERLVWTFRYEGDPGEPGVEIYTFTEQGGKTLLTTKSLFKSKEERDAVLQSGMVDGATETWDRLAEYVGSR
jgi:uncharacterized protein YndB with AHSA1/START domain